MAQAQEVLSSSKNSGKIFVMYEKSESSRMRFIGEVEEGDIFIIQNKCKDSVILVANQRPSSFPPTLNLSEENLKKNGFEIMFNQMGNK